ncbi:Avr9/Cf-9 rapidly elicited protein [Quillaja saponaria]|uniref:Avr9/Cf-9 rapidly elicited protein n=1 Tax=Quillaja saponaria TaxID=32244 RepID=A0AAD7PT56_QUISA|nr:Avr9/Cf-9 rapidly elicited protein [Quillaja saponaria]
MDQNCPSPMTEKLSKTLRLIGFVIQNGVSKTKVMHDNMDIMMKRGKVLGKAFNDLMVRHHTALSCRPRDPHVSFISPTSLEYQFSCTSSPPRPRYGSHVSKRRESTTHQYSRRKHHDSRLTHAPHRHSIDVSASLLGRVNITDHEEEEEEEEYQVDKAAEEFIARFYRELRMQKWLAACEAPDYYV